MAKGAKKVGNGETNPEFEERKRLKKLAHSKHILTSAPAKDFTPLSPSKTIVKHHGADILKKSQRRNRYLFSFCGLIAPITGGKIGELTNLGSKNPTLYLDFPQGRMKLCGTIVYPNSRYLTLQFSKGGKTVLCEDYFDTMVYKFEGPILSSILGRSMQLERSSIWGRFENVVSLSSWISLRTLALLLKRWSRPMFRPWLKSLAENTMEVAGGSCGCIISSISSSCFRPIAL